MADNRALDSKCPNCGNVLKWNPTAYAWKCEACDSTFSLEELQKRRNNAASSDNNVQVKKDEEVKVTEDPSLYKEKEEFEDHSTIEGTVEVELESIKEGEMDEYHCGNCGASIMATPETVATKCPYCNNTTILKQKLDGGVFPTKIIPFKKVRKDAEEGFYNIAKGKLFAPKNFHTAAIIKDVSGVYVPFWIYDISANGDIVFRCTDSRSWTSGEYRHTEVKTFHTTVNGNVLYNKLPVDGSSHFDDGLMDSIEPFDYNELIDYNHAYLSGFLAEKYDVDQQKAFERAIARAKNSTVDTFKTRVRHQTSSAVKDKVTYKVQNVEFAMFPVWMVNIEYNGKFYTFAMNGQTGETVGNIPLSIPRVIGFTLLFFIIVAGILLGIAYMISGGIF